VTFRLATVFGMSSRMRIDLLVNDFVHRAVTDRAVVVFEGHFKRNYIHIQDVARVFLHALEHFGAMKSRPYNVGLDDANLTKIELCQVIQRHVPEFIYVEAPIGEDPDKRDYIVSNARLAGTGFRTEWDLDRGIRELIKGVPDAEKLQVLERCERAARYLCCGARRRRRYADPPPAARFAQAARSSRRAAFPALGAAVSDRGRHRLDRDFDRVSGQPDRGLCRRRGPSWRAMSAANQVLSERPVDSCSRPTPAG